MSNKNNWDSSWPLTPPGPPPASEDIYRMHALWLSVLYLGQDSGTPEDVCRMSDVFYAYLMGWEPHGSDDEEELEEY